MKEVCPLKTRIKRLQIPEGKRVIAISDPHAHLSLLQKLLEKVGFCENDELFLVGDFLHKGPENLAMLRYVMELSQWDNVHIMMGNMEYWHWSLLQTDYPNGPQLLREQIQDSLDHFGTSLFVDMLEELAMPYHDDLDIAGVMPSLRDRFAAEITFLASLPAIIETDRLIFVHGGIASEDLSSFAEEDPHQFLKNNSFLTKGLCFQKHIIVGHWPVCNYRELVSHNPLVSEEQHIISIDGGCGVKDGAQINAFLITDEAAIEYSFIYCDSLSVKTAIEAQPESDTYINIAYGDHWVHMLEKGEEASFVEHVSTGRRLWVFNDSIWYEGEQACAVHNDYRLAVEPGDRLGVIKETNHGCYVKKDGLCGWYHGVFAQPEG